MLSPFFLCPCMLEITLNAHTHCYQRITNQTLRSLAETKLSPHTVSNGCWSHVSAHILKGTHLFKHYSLISLTLRRAQFLNTVFDQYISDQYMFWGFFYPPLRNNNLSGAISTNEQYIEPNCEAVFH